MTQHAAPEISLEITQDRSHFVATYAATGKPAATLTRRRIFNWNAPRFTAYALDGTLLFTTNTTETHLIARRIARTLHDRNHANAHILLHSIATPQNDNGEDYDITSLGQPGDLEDRADH